MTEEKSFKERVKEVVIRNAYLYKKYYVDKDGVIRYTDLLLGDAEQLSEHKKAIYELLSEELQTLIKVENYKKKFSYRKIGYGNH